MPNNPSATETKLDDVLKAWEELAKDKTFGGMTLDDFTAKAKPSLDAREEIAKLEKQMTSLIDQRDDADVETNRLIQLVVKGVVGDPSFGEDSALYEAMGYVRKSGLSRGNTPPPAQ